jgi:peptide/nickel transport system substrate-binding protein
MKYYSKLIYAMLSRFKGIIFISIIIGIASFFLVRFSSRYFFKGKNERIGYTGRYHTGELPDHILNLISDGLTELDENLLPKPAISTSWETPDKGKTWIFTLQEGVSWHDESILKSTNINYDFGDVEITTPDDKTISFKLQSPYTPFPSFVSRAIFKQGLIGTGEWKVDKLSVVGSYVQEITIVNEIQDKKTFKFYPTTDRTKLAFKLGEVDKVQNLLNPSPFDDWATVETEKLVNNNQVVTLFFNTSDKFLGDKSVRQALTYAINKQSLGTRAISSISPNSWAYNPQVKDYSYDIEKAKSTIDDLPKELKEDLKIHLVTSPALLDVAEKISNDWEIVGLNTQILVSSIIPTEFQAYLTIFDIPSDPDQYPSWHSTQVVNNISRLKSDRIDKLLEDGRSTLDYKERKKIYLDFQRFLLEEIPAAFLYHPDYYTVFRK